MMVERPLQRVVMPRTSRKGAGLPRRDDSKAIQPGSEMDVWVRVYCAVASDCENEATPARWADRAIRELRKRWGGD